MFGTRKPQSGLFEMLGGLRAPPGSPIEGLLSMLGVPTSYERQQLAQQQALRSALFGSPEALKPNVTTGEGAGGVWTNPDTAAADPNMMSAVNPGKKYFEGASPVAPGSQNWAGGGLMNGRPLQDVQLAAIAPEVAVQSILSQRFAPPKDPISLPEGGSLWDPNTKQVIAQGAPKLTDDMREWQAAKNAGTFSGNFMDWTKAQADAARGPQDNWVTIQLPDGSYVQKNTKTGQISALPGAGDARPTFKHETDLRGEFTNQAKPYQEVFRSYEKLAAAGSKPNPTGADDIALVYGYMKMLDPTSVVREGEFATAANAGGVPDKVLSLYNRVARGERLSPEVRADYLRQAEYQFGAAKKGYSNLVDQYGTLARNYRLDPRNVVVDFLGTGGRQNQNPQQAGQPAEPPAQGGAALPPSAPGTTPGLPQVGDTSSLTDGEYVVAGKRVKVTGGRVAAIQ